MQVFATLILLYYILHVRASLWMYNECTTNQQQIERMEFEHERTVAAYIGLSLVNRICRDTQTTTFNTRIFVSRTSLIHGRAQE